MRNVLASRGERDWSVISARRLENSAFHKMLINERRPHLAAGRAAMRVDKGIAVAFR